MLPALQADRNNMFWPETESELMAINRWSGIHIFPLYVNNFKTSQELNQTETFFRFKAMLTQSNSGHLWLFTNKNFTYKK